MTRDEQIAAVERDRKKREAGLLVLMLALAERARLNVVRSIRVGASWASVLRGVLLGDDRIDPPGGVPMLARVMADSHVSGYARVGRLLDVALPAALVVDSLAEQYKPAATSTLARIADGLTAAVTAELANVAEADRISADAKAVGDAFDKYGWTPEHQAGAVAESSAAVLWAYAAGMHAGYKAPPAVSVLTGLIFWNPMDESTTPICRARHGVTLPMDHPWWFRNWSPLHWGCRSLQLPTTRQVVYTVNPPNYPPPDPGFGNYAGMIVGGPWS